MCKRRSKTGIELSPKIERVEGYTGATISLDRERLPATKRKQCSSSGFPFWTLWLIWPLIGVAKSLAPVVIGSFALIGQGLMLALPVLLIVVGVLLLRRS